MAHVMHFYIISDLTLFLTFPHHPLPHLPSSPSHLTLFLTFPPHPLPHLPTSPSSSPSQPHPWFPTCQPHLILPPPLIFIFTLHHHLIITFPPPLTFQANLPLTSFLPTSAVLPESEHSCSPKQTSPRHSVYPTWTKEFVFPGLSRATLSEGGLEVILYDHHRLHRVNIGGIRLCVPRLKEPSPVLTQKSFQRDGSIILFGQAKKDGGERAL